MNLNIRHPMDNPHKVTSPFGWWINPVSGREEGHSGVDIIRMPPITGTLQIYAVADGVVERATWNVPNSHTGNVTTNQAGNRVAYRIADNILVDNMHMTFGSVTHRVGDTVKQGDIIGTMGATGLANGRHLHFELRDGNAPFDPLPFIINAPHENIKPELATPITFMGSRVDLPVINVDERNFGLPSDFLRVMTGRDVLHMTIDGVEMYGIRDWFEALGYSVTWTTAEGIVITK